jgi:hypothetical protein
VASGGRRVSSNADRVRRRHAPIRAAISQIAKHHLSLGAHLTSTISLATSARTARDSASQT